jgi:hypothetical protein
MIRRPVRSGGGLLAAFMLLWLLSGCTGASEPQYQGDMSREPKNLTTFDQGPVRLGLPPGYKPKPLPPNAGGELTQWFQKEGSSANLQVYCYGLFVSKPGLRLNLLKTTEAVMPNAKQSLPPQSIGTSNLSPVFEGYTGTVTANGQEVPMAIYLAWKLDSRIGGCKYGIFAVVAQNQSDAFFPEFVAIVRSLQ